MANLESQGAKIIAWGFNDEATPKRAPYDYFAAIVFPTELAAARYEKLFSAAGWYDYFEQVNVGGDIAPFDEILKQLVEL